MPSKIQDMPRRRRPIPVAPTQQQRPVAAAAATPQPPISQGVDAVVAWLNDVNLAMMAEVETASPSLKNKHKALQLLITAFGRCRAVARDVELLLRAREQRDGVAAAVAYQAEAPIQDPVATPLWHALELARLVKLVADAAEVDKDDVAAIQTRIKHHVAGVTVRETGLTAEFKRRHRIGSDVAGAVEGYAQVQAQLEKEALTAGDAEDARDDLAAFGHFMKSDFASPWHVRVVCDALMRAERREIRGLIINMPPRRGKSTCASELFPAWYLGRHPTHDIIVATHSQSFADSVGRKIRNAIQSPEYQRVFPGVHVANDSSAAAVFEIVVDGAPSRQRRGNCKTFGRGGAPAGSGSHCLLIDDFLSEQDAYSATERGHLVDDLLAFRTRLAPDAVWIVINTRYHEDDVVGVVKRDFADDREWTVITLPEFAEVDEEWVVTSPATRRRAGQRHVYRRKVGDALWPERFSAESSEQLRAALMKVAPHKWWGQFMCRPVPASGALVDVAWFRRYDYGDVMEYVRKASRLVVSIDSGGTKLRERAGSGYGARTAITVWAELEDGRLYLVDVAAEPWIYPDMLKAIKEICQEWKPTDLLIEDKAAGVELIADLSEHRDWVRTPITGIMPFGPKETRMAVASPQIRAGQVYVPAAGPCADVAAVRCPAPEWLNDFLNEIMHFPLGSRKDLCLPGNTLIPVLRDHVQLISAQDVKLGDLVLTHKGRWRAVTQVLSRKYQGTLHSIKRRGWPQAFDLTPEHPILATQAERQYTRLYFPRNGQAIWCDAASVQRGDVVHEINIEEAPELKSFDMSFYPGVHTVTDEYVRAYHKGTKIPRHVVIDGDLMRLFGYYIAEGSTGHHNVSWAFAADEAEFVSDVQAILRKHFNVNSSVQYTRTNGATVSCSSRVLTPFFKSLFGQGARNKALPNWIFGLPSEMQLEFLKGAYRGDGCMSNGSLVYTTSSISLAWGITKLLTKLQAVCGVTVSRPKGVLKRITSKKNLSFCHPLYNVVCALQHANVLATKLGFKPTAGGKYHRKTDQLNAKGIGRLVTDVVENVFDGLVYNFEVEEDHSYHTATCVVHNCDSTSQILNWRRENPLFSNYSDVTAMSPAKQALCDALATPWGSQYGRSVQPRRHISRSR